MDIADLIRNKKLGNAKDIIADPSIGGAIRDPQFWADIGKNLMATGSRTAANIVGGPVDIANLALMGMNKLAPDLKMTADKPVMGSEWLKGKMNQAGMVTSSGNHTADEYGDLAAGMLAMGIPSKAPQIASGLLKAGDNLNAPRMLNPETGAVLWHGSPHKFDKFDASKIGTGEGSQAYGHGLYLADAPDVAKSYAATLAFKNNASIVQNGPNNYSVVAKDGSKVVDGVLLGKAHKAKDAFDAAQGSSLYKVDLPDQHIAKMLDWDKPLSQQHPDVQQILKSAGIDPTKHGGNGATLISELNGSAGIADMPWMGQGEALLQKAGIPGIRYLDGGSRTGGAGTSNYVVFPGNEGLLQILERNGQTLGANNLNAAKRTGSIADNAINKAAIELQSSGQNGKIDTLASKFVGHEPTPQPQRIFNDDYPQAIESSPGSRLTTSIDGDTLSPTARIAGRNVVGGVDEGVSTTGIASAAENLGGTWNTVGRGLLPPHTVGTFNEPTRRINILNTLSDYGQGRTGAHETGHLIDMIAGKIPTKGLESPLSQMYSELNTQGYVSKWQKGSKPEEFGYKGDDVGREKMAESVYSYLRDPNYIKSKFPEVAKRIREYVNTNPELKDVIQFNSGVGAVGLAADESRNYADGGSVGADGAGIDEDATTPATYAPNPDHYDYRYSKAPASSNGAPTWLDTYNAWLPGYKSKFGGDINRSWAEDADSVAQKEALDKQYISSLDQYNARTGSTAQADKTMLGGLAQPNTFTRPKQGMGGFEMLVLGAIAAMTGGAAYSAFGAGGGGLGAAGAAEGAAGAAGGDILATGAIGGEGLGGAAFNAAADSQLANVAINAAGGDALAGYGGAVSAATPAGSSGFQAALDAYKAAQPYIKGANAVKAVADGNPMGAIASYLPGFDFGDATVNQFANPAIRTAIQGGNPINGLVSSGINVGLDAAIGSAPSDVQGLANDVKQLLPMAQAVAAASKGKLTISQAMAMLKSYNAGKGT